MEAAGGGGEGEVMRIYLYVVSDTNLLSYRDMFCISHGVFGRCL